MAGLVFCLYTYLPVRNVLNVCALANVEAKMKKKKKKKNEKKYNAMEDVIRKECRLRLSLKTFTVCVQSWQPGIAATRQLLIHISRTFIFATLECIAKCTLHTEHSIIITCYYYYCYYCEWRIAWRTRSVLVVQKFRCMRR